ncbi:hypothetical protein D3C85_1509660 [compost metagenome]
MLAGICTGNKPEGSRLPEMISNTACEETPKFNTIPSAIASNSLKIIGLLADTDTITGLPFIISLVSKMVCKSIVLLATVDLFLKVRSVMVGSTTGSPAAMLFSLASTAVYAPYCKLIGT